MQNMKSSTKTNDNFRKILFLHLQGITLIPTLDTIFQSDIIDILLNNKR